MRAFLKAVFRCGLSATFVLAIPPLARAAEPLDPFTTLAQAYATRDADLAASAYADDAVVTYRYEGTAEERFTGRSEIRRSFSQLFSSIDAKQSLDLNFRTETFSNHNKSGVYRLRVGSGGVSYGRFVVTTSPDGRFATDASSYAKRADFEELGGRVLIKPDAENLDRRYYSALSGRYRLPNGCIVVVTRSIARLFARDTCSQVWRGLTRTSGRVWTGGDRVLSSKVSATYRFESIVDDASPAVVVEAAGSRATAKRVTTYRTEDVTFPSFDGSRLAGTVYLPVNARRSAPATVLVHGSGSQDRDGYASIMAVLADELASRGRVVLAYDKRGSGASEGSGTRAGFPMLAADAAAGMRLLSTRPEVDAKRVGLAGSSQAGWVVAQAIADGARPADVFLLGAAGTASTVLEQNLYNTRVRMLCASIPIGDVELALAQQRAFFLARRDRSKARELDELTARARVKPALLEWLFPDSSDLVDTDAWYTVLNPAFDPRPAWYGYGGRAFFVFSEHDDSTDTRLSVQRLSQSTAKLVQLGGAQHLGLEVMDRCHAGLTDADRFTPALFRALRDYAR